MGFIVTEKAQRPANMNGACFYCHQKIGLEHTHACVLIKKKVKVRMTVEYEIDVPASWSKESIEFSRNESSWCANNAIDELENVFDKCESACMCASAKFEYLCDTSEPFINED